MRAARTLLLVLLVTSACGGEPERPAVGPGGLTLDDLASEVGATLSARSRAFVAGFGTLSPEDLAETWFEPSHRTDLGARFVELLEKRNWLDARPRIGEGLCVGLAEGDAFAAWSQHPVEGLEEGWNLELEWTRVDDEWYVTGFAVRFQTE